jgi:7-cyano-7-deazaguanine synthase
MTNVVIYSGGMDSYTLLHYVDHMYGDEEPAYALSFNYGQRHARELDCAIRECQEMIDLGALVAHHVIDLRSAKELLQGSALVRGPAADIDVPEGHYAEESMRLTVVPGRNTLMLSYAMAYAESLILLAEKAAGTKFHAGHHATIYFGAHAGDHHIYPDCRPGYIEAFDQMSKEATDGRVRLLAPFQDKTKGDILSIGKTLGLDYANTWTCYKGGDRPCGVCGSCTERREAFEQNGMVDPTYA